MARVKKGVNAHKRHKKILKQAKRLLRSKEQGIQSSQSGRNESAQIGLRRQKAEEETVQTDVDCKNQRCGKGERNVLQQTDGWTEEERNRNQQKDAFRDGDLRCSGFCTALRDSEKKRAEKNINRTGDTDSRPAERN